MSFCEQETYYPNLLDYRQVGEIILELIKKGVVRQQTLSPWRIVDLGCGRNPRKLFEMGTALAEEWGIGLDGIALQGLDIEAPSSLERSIIPFTFDLTQPLPGLGYSEIDYPVIMDRAYELIPGSFGADFVLDIACSTNIPLISQRQVLNHAREILKRGGVLVWWNFALVTTWPREIQPWLTDETIALYSPGGEKYPDPVTGAIPSGNRYVYHVTLDFLFWLFRDWRIISAEYMPYEGNSGRKTTSLRVVVQKT